MLTVPQMLPKNHFLTGICSGYDKIYYQEEPQLITTLDFTGNCVGVYYLKESSNKPFTEFTGAEIFNFSSTKPDFGLVLCARGIETNRSNFKMKTAKSNKFLQVFTS